MKISTSLLLFLLANLTIIAAAPAPQEDDADESDNAYSGVSDLFNQASGVAHQSTSKSGQRSAAPKKGDPKIICEMITIVPDKDNVQKIQVSLRGMNLDANHGGAHASIGTELEAEANKIKGARVSHVPNTKGFDILVKVMNNRLPNVKAAVEKFISPPIPHGHEIYCQPLKGWQLETVKQ